MTIQAPVINDAFYVLDRPMVLGEGPIYRHEDSTLHYVDCLHNPPQLHILSLDPESGDAKHASHTKLEHASIDSINTSRPGLRVLNLEDSVTVHFFRKGIKGSYICLYYQGIAFMDEATGKLDVVKEIIPHKDRSIRRFNDGGVDPNGRFWAAEIDVKALSYPAGTLPNDYGKPLGRLWRYSADGTLKKMEDGLICGNGLGWSPDATVMYLNDSASQIIWKYDYDNETGDLSNKCIFRDFRGTPHEPDGMVLDTEGNLWIAMYNGQCVMVIDPRGKTVDEIWIPAKRAACTTWGGKNNDIIYLVSAWDRTPSRSIDDQGGHLFKIPTQATGLVKNEFAG